MILVTAGHGHQGRLLIPKLKATGLKVRATRITPGKEDELYALGADEVIVGDLADVDVYAHALEGVSTVYHVGPGLVSGEKEMGFALIEAALRCKTRHVVMSSVHHSIINIVQHRYKRDIEERLIESGLQFTILKPCDFMMEEVYIAPAVANGVYPMFWQEKAGRKGSLIDLHDLTDVALKVIVEGDKHFQASYELVGPDKLTSRDIVRILSDVTGRRIEIAQQTPRDLFQLLCGVEVPSTPVLQHKLDVLTSIADWYSKYDFVGNSNILRWLLGRPPTTFEQFARRAYERMQRSD